ncbi:unnamed protein product [Phaedon cochleariae]|uniref:Zinc transporter foi n=1 Tax=Phaedon cochleariae TaxID=80249 RepID=A0A9P0GR40_PHACE|nr:unnamed protein product [Phaedon cochleariae]
MPGQVISVCIFCFLCMTHSSCESHSSTNYDSKDLTLLQRLQIPPQEKLRYVSPSLINDKTHQGKTHVKVKRNSDSNNDDDETDSDYIKKIFRLYSDGNVITADGFQRFLLDLGLHEKIKQVDGRTELKSNSTCSQSHQHNAIPKPNSSDVINQTEFYETCPTILYGLLAHRLCPENASSLHEETPSPLRNNGFVWLCSILAVILISACGVLSLAIVPVMKKKMYKPMIQFLVALAVGTLMGDALLHLLPHAMSAPHAHEGEHDHVDHLDHDHDQNIQKGGVAMMGVIFFFVMERFISLAGKWRKKRQRHQHSHVTVLDEEMNKMNKGENDTQCMDRYNSVPFCYKDIMNDPNTIYESNRTGATGLDPSSNSEVQPCKNSKSPTLDILETNQSIIECAGGDIGLTTEINKMLTPENNHNEDYTVIVREHKSDHHGHSHKHGHVHSAPQNFSSVAWMVIMGDGLHNFTDGMAIGAAFAGSLAGGFSTTIAVFCHELPHELGDFAMLLKAGMTIKQALYYNVLSSVLCVFGNVFGLVLGNTEYASSWVFAAAAGMFIYIALVDMIPELSSAHEDEGDITVCILHLGGLLLGFAIMALIAFYEHDLLNIFSY